MPLYRSGRRVVVGVDGSAVADRALLEAAKQAVQRDALLHVVHAWQVPPFPGTALLPPPATLTGEEAAARRVLDESVRSVLPDLRPAPRLHTELVRGGAATALLGLAQGAELLVVGARARGALPGLLLGSVSQDVVVHASCPVLVVPLPADGQSGDHLGARVG